MTLYAVVMTSFFAVFISKITWVRIVEIAPNDAEYMISYLSSTQYLVIFPSEKELIQKNVFFALDASEQYYIIFHYARNYDILVMFTNNLSYSIDETILDSKATHTCIPVCKGGALQWY